MKDLEITEQDTAMALAPKQEMLPPTPLTILNTAVQRGADIDTIERLVALQEKMLERDAKIGFNEAMNRVQSEIKRIAPDKKNSHTNSMWATYAAIDRVIRPIYSKEGFSLSFTHADCPTPDYIRVICIVARGAHEKPYQVDWPVDTKGAKGNDVVTRTQATGISDSYAKRYLVKDIFNIAIGEEDTDGVLLTKEVRDFLENIRNSDQYQLQGAFKEAYASTKDMKTKAVYLDAYEARKKELK